MGGGAALSSHYSENRSPCGRQCSFSDAWPSVFQLVGEAVLNPVCPGCGTGQPLPEVTLGFVICEMGMLMVLGSQGK